MNLEALAIQIAQEHLKQEGHLCINVTSCSMVPFLRIGDKVTVRRLKKHASLGDILMVDYGGFAIIHRLIGRQRIGLVLKGDALYRPDVTIKPERILGVVVERIRDGQILNLYGLRMRFWAVIQILKANALTFMWRAWYGV